MEEDVDIPPEFDGEIIERTDKKVNDTDPEEIIRYQKGIRLGKGGFSVCYKCICLNTKKIYAMTQINIV